MHQFFLYYMDKAKDGKNRHFSIMIQAKTEEEAYLYFHKIGYSGWLYTTDFRGNIVSK